MAFKGCTGHGLLAAVFWACSAFASAAASTGDVAPAHIDDVVARAMKAFAVPGVAVGIVKDGKLIFARGYGVRELGKPATVDPDTLFAIGSVTKSFTTASLAMLVDEGKVSWDDRVTDYLPEFRLYDPYVTAEFTIRDLLTHRSGLRPSAGDLMVFPDTDFTRAEVIAGLRYLHPVSSFRSRFAYDNVLYMVAGQVIQKVSHTSWEEFVQERLLRRLGMSACTVGTASDAVNVARTHAVVDGKLQVVQPVALSVIAPAGGIQCNVTGMARWLMVQLAGGKLADGTLFTAAQQREMWSPQTIGPVSPLLTKLHGTHFRSYGLGWNLEDFHGYKRVFHSGGVLGMSSHVTLLPELNVGIVVLSNQQSADANNAITLHIATAYAGARQQDWVSLFKAADDAGRGQVEVAQSELRRTLAAAGPPPLPASAYVGWYHDPWRGDAVIKQDGAQLTLSFSRTRRMTGTLQHYRNGVFVVRWADRSLDADAFVSFGLDFAGSVADMTLQGLPTADNSFDYQDLNFHKVAADGTPVEAH